jgi:hypothetical protein
MPVCLEDTVLGFQQNSMTEIVSLIQELRIIKDKWYCLHFIQVIYLKALILDIT